MIRHDRKYCWLIYCDRKILLNGWQIRLISSSVVTHRGRLKFKRKLFLIRLSFAMTINKAQGQTIPNAGVYLPKPVFSHGQLYVALSKATVKSNIKILASHPVIRRIRKRRQK